MKNWACEEVKRFVPENLQIVILDKDEKSVQCQQTNRTPFTI